MPDSNTVPRSEDKPPKFSDLLREEEAKLRASHGESQTEVSGSVPEPGQEQTKSEGQELEKAGKTPKKSIDEILAQLPEEDRKLAQKAYRSVQSENDRIKARFSKFEGLSEEELNLARLLAQDKNLAREVADYLESSRKQGSANDGSKAGSERFFDALINDPNLDGYQRQQLMKFRQAIKEEAQDTIRELEKRIQTLERIAYQAIEDGQRRVLSEVRDQLGDDLYEKYEEQALKLMRTSGLSPIQAFRAVMSDEDLMEWKRPQVKQNLERKKQASEITGTTSLAASQPAELELKAVGPEGDQKRREWFRANFKRRIQEMMGIS
jgi:hypothetical protein